MYPVFPVVRNGRLEAVKMEEARVLDGPARSGTLEGCEDNTHCYFMDLVGIADTWRGTSHVGWSDRYRDAVLLTRHRPFTCACRLLRVPKKRAAADGRTRAGHSYRLTPSVPFPPRAVSSRTTASTSLCSSDQVVVIMPMIAVR